MYIPLPIEERISAIAETSYVEPLRETNEMLHVWILRTEFRTQEVQAACSRKVRPLFRAIEQSPAE